MRTSIALVLVAVLHVSPLGISTVGSGEPSPPTFVRGDSNADGVVDISDAQRSLFFLFLCLGCQPECLDAADADDSGQYDITDIVYTLVWLFLGGHEPPPPTPSTPTYAIGDCGIDPTDDSFDCESFPPCL